MTLLRLIIATIFIAQISCSEHHKLKNEKVNSLVSDICISINDFENCFKSICIDSSGFYYLYCSKNEPGKVNRIDLSKYTAELQLFKSLDSNYFIQLDKCRDTTCGMGKEPFTVFIKENGKEFISHPGSYVDCDSSSCFYKMELIRDFFKKLKKNSDTEFAATNSQSKKDYPLKIRI
ncbi:MAG: hypothetical protein QM737_17290 [Ferruginibacter sp.]